MVPARIAAGVVACACIAIAAGCSKPPRSSVDIIKERDELPGLYLTEKTKQRVIAKGSELKIADPKSKEVAWQAHACANPDCPGRKNDEPFLFIHVLVPGHFVTEDGKVGFDAQKGGHEPPYHGCPECLKKRNLATETPQESAKYNLFDKLYELPESAKRRALLDEELKKAMAPRTN